jgi:hypothetical protein
MAQSTRDKGDNQIASRKMKNTANGTSGHANRASDFRFPERRKRIDGKEVERSRHANRGHLRPASRKPSIYLLLS